MTATLVDIPIADGLPPGSSYELLLRLASGGLATVFVGRRRREPGAPLVAIKLPHPHLADSPEIRQMLALEAEIGRSVRHPNLVAVRELEEHDGKLVLVMPYVEGATLAELLEANGGALDLAVVLRILADLTAGLSALHQAVDDDGGALEIVHGDVSPHNALVAAEGVTALFDLGLATRPGSPRAAPGGTRGTLAYAAPECVNGEPPTQRSDVFSLGVVAWEAIAGRRLFAGASQAATLTAIVEEAALPLDAVAGVDQELGAIVAGALAKDPNDRVEAGELADLLGQYAAGSAYAAASDGVARLVNRLVGSRLAARRAVLRVAASR